ncbi:MAG TPA: hypothetical protein VLW50_12310 [Streptosporangiaceae bacterium]|nr:hypothetical protein [Streptosporangiaceae bacterium]
MAGLECGDERQACLFDDRGGALGRDCGFGGAEVGGECLVAEDGGCPAGEVVARAAVPQYALVAAGERGFQFGEVGGDRAGEGVGFSPEVEPAGGLGATGRTCARGADGE